MPAKLVPSKPLSRQRLWQIKMRLTDRCELCGQKAERAGYCQRHYGQRRKYGLEKYQRDREKCLRYSKKYYRKHRKKMLAYLEKRRALVKAGAWTGHMPK